jgi:hypothetical protein
MTITIDSTGRIVKAKKPRKTAAPRKARKGCAEKRSFPKWHEGMSTGAYIRAYHEANAAVSLSTVEYLCN